LPETADDWIRERNITALVVLKNGEIVFEEYFKGTSAEDRRIGWSVAKSYLSALVGILIDEGRIADWVIASTTPSAPPAAPKAPATGKFYDYGYQWWIPKDASPREYLARGIYGQYIYINEPENVVIVTNSADRQFREPGIDPSNVEMFRLITGNL
jgi:CubicO group peptidase (beta-lactamase class C family)